MHTNLDDKLYISYKSHPSDQIFYKLSETTFFNQLNTIILFMS